MSGKEFGKGWKEVERRQVGAVGDETEAKMDLVKRCESKSVMVVLSHWYPIRGKYTATSRL